MYIIFNKVKVKLEAYGISARRGGAHLRNFGPWSLWWRRTHYFEGHGATVTSRLPQFISLGFPRYPFFDLLEGRMNSWGSWTPNACIEPGPTDFFARNSKRCTTEAHTFTISYSNADFFFYPNVLHFILLLCSI